LKAKQVDRPIELSVVVFLEVFVGIRYLLNVIIFLSVSSPTPDYSWVVYLLLMLISFLVAYGLWNFARWAWLTAVALSVLGVVSTTSLLTFSDTSMALLFQYIPSIALDLLAIALLLMKRVKNLFWGARTGNDLPSPAASPHNP
jgi:hypothetical protein